VATITTTIDLDENAFSFQIDSKTGKQIINLSKDLIENYGLENVEFEQIIDENTGQTIYRMKPVIGKDGKVYELITDLTTGSMRK
jgi:predicted small secreted protein